MNSFDILSKCFLKSDCKDFIEFPCQIPLPDNINSIYISDLQTSKNPKTFSLYGIKSVISFCEIPKKFLVPGIDYNFLDPGKSEGITAASEKISEKLEDGNLLLVCRGGDVHGPSCALYFLVSHKIFSLYDSADWLKKFVPEAKPGAIFLSKLCAKFC